MHFRWGHPINLLLYPAIFDEHPEERCEEIATLIAKQESADRIHSIIRETKLELDDPTQQLRDILESRATEKDLRRYLRCAVEQLQKMS